MVQDLQIYSLLSIISLRRGQFYLGRSFFKTISLHQKTHTWRSHKPTEMQKDIITDGPGKMEAKIVLMLPQGQESLFLKARSDKEVSFLAGYREGIEGTLV